MVDIDVRHAFSDSKRSLSFWQLLCFGVLTTPLAMAGLALVMFVPTFYAVDMGLGLTAVGAVFVFGRFFDVVTDPLIGNLSDETRSRFGPRAPWMVVGVPLFCVAVWLLFSPPDGIGIVYLIVASALFFLFYTVVDVPYSSIGLEISPDVHERSWLASAKAVFQVLGAISAASIPFVLAVAIPEALSMLTSIIIALSALGLVAFLMFVPRPNRPVTAPKNSLWRALKWVFTQNRFRFLVGSFFIVQAANALTAGLFVLYVTHIIQAPTLIGGYTGAMFAASAVFLPVWVFISKRWSKKIAWMTGIVVCMGALSVVPFLGDGDVLAFGIIAVVIGATFGADAVMPTSMLADIVYDDENQGKNRFAGTYLAVKNAVSKMTFVIPMGIAFPLLDFFGFDAGGTNEKDQLFMLVAFVSLVPIALRCLALVVLWFAPRNLAAIN